MSGMEKVTGKFTSLMDMILPWEEEEVEEEEVLETKSQHEQRKAGQQKAASVRTAEEYKVSGGNSIFVAPAEERRTAAPSYREPSRVTTRRQFTVHTTKVAELSVKIYVPEDFDLVTSIADDLKAGKAAVVNYESVAAEEQRRICDFVNGACYVVNGCAKRISEQIVLYAPEGVDVADAMPMALTD